MSSASCGASRVHDPFGNPPIDPDATERLHDALAQLVTQHRRSNALFARLLDRVSPFRPWNDMQVRLVNQAMGGPVAKVEVVGRVAEGNHWQWQLAEGAVPPSVMDPEMVRRTPDVDMLAARALPRAPGCGAGPQVVTAAPACAKNADAARASCSRGDGVLSYDGVQCPFVPGSRASRS